MGSAAKVPKDEGDKVSLPYSVPKGWRFACDDWRDPSLVVPLTGQYAGMVMRADSELAKCLGFTLTATQVTLLRAASIHYE